MAELKIVFISDYTVAELYIIEKVQQIYPDAAVVCPNIYDSDEGPPTFYKKRPFLKHFIRGITWKIHRTCWERKFYPGQAIPEIANRVPADWNKLNTPEGTDQIKKLDPDILITLRAPIISNNMIQVPKLAAINIHFGIAPEYRGNDTIFWPLYYKDYDYIGGTIHHLSEGVDKGNMLAQVKPDLHPFDGEIRLEYKTVCNLTDALLHFLDKVQNSQPDLTGKKQEKYGRNFKAIDRTIVKSFFYIGRRMIGLSCPPKQKGSVVYWY